MNTPFLVTLLLVTVAASVITFIGGLLLGILGTARSIRQDGIPLYFDDDARQWKLDLDSRPEADAGWMDGNAWQEIHNFPH